MNNTNKFFNILSLVLLAIALPISVYIIKNGSFDLTIEAFLSDEPLNINITDIRNNSAKITWYTEKTVYGQLKFIDSLEPINETKSTKYHEITLSNLDTFKKYSFQIYSDGKLFEPIYSLTTYSESMIEDNHFIIGQIFSTDGLTTQNGGIIFLSLNDGVRNSQKLSAIINEVGGYKFNLSGIRYDDGSYFDHKRKVDLDFEVFINPKQDNVNKVFTINLASEYQIPNIYLAEPELDIIPGIEGN